MRDVRLNPMCVENDMRVGTGGDVFDDHIDRSPRGRFDLAGQDHHSFRQSRGEIVRERVKDEWLQRRGPQLVAAHFELMIGAADDDLASIEARRQFEALDSDWSSANIRGSRGRDAIE